LEKIENINNESKEDLEAIEELKDNTPGVFAREVEERTEKAKPSYKQWNESRLQSQSQIIKIFAKQ